VWCVLGVGCATNVTLVDEKDEAELEQELMTLL
jgi:hypothetical protein